MTWGAGFRFARPVRWILAKLDEQTIEVPLEGVPSGGHSFGHRFAHPGPVEVPSASRFVRPSWSSALLAASGRYCVYFLAYAAPGKNGCPGDGTP